MKSLVRQVRLLFNTFLIITTILVQSGAPKKDHQKKERHTMKKLMNSATNKMTIICTISWKRLFSILNRRISKIITAYVWHIKQNESISNVIAYVASKNNTMAHSIRLNNMISCVVGIYIFGFKTHWKRVFNFMETKTTPTFIQFLQAKKINSNKNKSYYQQYDLKIMRDFHKQTMIIFLNNNILANQSGMDYSPGIHFQKRIVNMDEAKALIMNNKPVKSRDEKKGSGVAP